MRVTKRQVDIGIILFASSLLLGIGFILGRSTFVDSHMPVTAATQPAGKTSLAEGQAHLLSRGFGIYASDTGPYCHPLAAILGAHSPRKAVEYYQAFQAHDEAKLQELANRPKDFDHLTVDDELEKSDDGTVEEIPVLRLNVKTGAQTGKTLYVALPLLKAEHSSF